MGTFQDIPHRLGYWMVLFQTLAMPENSIWHRSSLSIGLEDGLVSEVSDRQRFKGIRAADFGFVALRGWTSGLPTVQGCLNAWAHCPRSIQLSMILRSSAGASSA